MSVRNAAVRSYCARVLRRCGGSPKLQAHVVDVGLPSQAAPMAAFGC